MLEFNNFCMVNVIELGSKSQKSQWFQGFKLIVDVHRSSSLLMFIRKVHSSCSLFGFMFTLIPRLIRRFQGIIFSNIQGQAGSKVIMKGIFKGILKGIFESILKGFFTGIFESIFEGIIVVSLRVIDGGFCLGNELLTIRVV
jgi:hypothetical protein